MSRGAIRRLPRPERAFGPIAGTILLLFVWAGVAHASGSGWVQAVGAVLGLVAPALAAWRLGVVVRSSPTDAVAGSPVTLEVVAVRALRCTPRQGPSTLLGRGEPASVVVVPTQRGVVTSVTLRLATASPLGLLWWSRDRVLELARPLVVAPREGEPSFALVHSPSSEAGRKRPRPALSGDPRGVRPYQHGDSRRRVHWHASAHTGDLMVRESEMRVDEPVRIVVDLPRDNDAADRLAEVAMGTVVLELGRGRSVVLETTEKSGRLVSPVTDRLSAGRRLARAVASGAESEPVG
jgi:uncharacterized protein (DUF58 family)